MARYWTQTQAAAAIARWRSSGLSSAAFCAKEGWNRSRLSYWQRRLDREGVPGFVEVVPASPAVLLVEVGGARISVGAGFDTALLRRVVEALR